MAAFDAFAKANNLKTTVVSPNGEWLSFTTTVGEANKLFGTSFQTFEDTATQKSLVRTLSVSLPSELVGHVDVVHPTTSFEDSNVRLTPIRTGFSAKRTVPSSCNSTITPACLQALYGILATPATQASNTLGVTAYEAEYAQTADLVVSCLSLR